MLGRKSYTREEIDQLAPERSVLRLPVGDPIRITGPEFDRLSAAFFAELERRYT